MAKGKGQKNKRKLRITPRPSTTKPNGQATQLSVNQRLEQLRREASQNASSSQIEEVFQAVSTRSVPRNLRELLQIPETGPILPRTRRGGRRIDSRRGIPGPPPPPSWLNTRSWDPLKPTWPESSLLNEPLQQTPKFSKLSSLNLPGRALPKEHTLLDYCFKSIARSWDTIPRFVKDETSITTTQLREALLAYISTFGPRYAFKIEHLRAFFELEDALDLVWLDLTGLISANLTLQNLSNFLSEPDDAIYQIDDSEDPESVEQDYQIEDSDNLSWEEQADREEWYPLQNGLETVAFVHLTHLSLADAGKFASWKDLLNLAPKLFKITHLSLAHWPTPSMTPNSTKQFIETSHGIIPAGGTDNYSVTRGDWAEAANILRRFSEMTRSLEWLDLQGCERWVPALIFREDQDYDEAWNGQDYYIQSGPNWNGGWSRVTYLNLSQDWIPSTLDDVKSITPGAIQDELMVYVKRLKEQRKESETEERKLDDQGNPVEDLTAPHNVDYQFWPLAEHECRKVEEAIRTCRKGMGPWCNVDHGWHGSIYSKRHSEKPDVDLTSNWLT
ncbi:hypothetical protein BT63DRAFT_451663 [Microthyrium microscopicum]|uniref:Tafazzin n=1 Tax=Microthyrium microscopicum TaxID=703497 RepID=A0A6A6UQE3_9PEZI|nr:hypothetical protein BT63DRAFT_451663 [Microthyrium microscopicum]